MRIRIQKRAEVAGGAPARRLQCPGRIQPAGFSIPVDYWLEGELVSPIEVGKPVMVNRDTRNGVKMPGIFQTSPVTRVTASNFTTLNSVYDFEQV